MSYHAYGASAEIVNTCGDNAFLDDTGTCQCLPGYIVPKPDAGCQPAVMGGAVTLQPVTIVGTPGGGPVSTPAPMPPAAPPTTAQKLNLASPWILGAAIGVLALVGLAALAAPKRSSAQPYRATPNPRRPPKGWWEDCVAGVTESGSAADPRSVCGALWHRKMSPKQRRAALRRHEGRAAPNYGMELRQDRPRAHEAFQWCVYARTPGKRRWVKLSQAAPHAYAEDYIRSSTDPRELRIRKCREGK
jgi:hypothetical protein